jgi:hypothetical protein
MKITGELFDQLKIMVQSSPIFPDLLDYRDRGLSDQRYRWDCLWAINSYDRDAWFDEVYQFANDDDVDNALRKITGTR